jgi:hypothetical protein
MTRGAWAVSYSVVGPPLEAVRATCHLGCQLWADDIRFSGLNWIKNRKPN